MTSVLGFLAARSLWQRYGIAFTLGGLSALALPPLGFFPVLWVTFPGLLWVLESISARRQAFAAGWAFGMGYFVVSLYWISFSLFTDISQYWWALPFSVAGLPLLLAIYTGLATWITHESRCQGWSRLFMFSATWGAAEFLRGYLFTGFPWNLVGYVWVDTLPILQSAAWIGVYGLSVLTVMMASAPFMLCRSPLWWQKCLIASLSLLLPLSLWVGGYARLETQGKQDSSFVDGVRLRLVQASIPQTLKWDNNAQLGHFQKHLDLSQVPGPTPTHIIWPETAVPWTLNTHSELRQQIATILPPAGVLLTGGLRVESHPLHFKTFFNSIFAINDKGDISDFYDKFHLVPFGEYLPFRNYLPFDPIASGGSDFGRGAGPQTLLIPGAPPVSPLVCYEIIFPGQVTRSHPRPAWILNVTNDAWFGFSAGPHQHFAIARVRAVEEGLPVVRAANTGISGVIDSYGRVLNSLPIGREGIIDSSLPRPANTSTLYSKYRQFPALGVIFGMFAFSFSLQLFSKNRKIS